MDGEDEGGTLRLMMDHSWWDERERVLKEGSLRINIIHSELPLYVQRRRVIIGIFLLLAVMASN